MSQGNNGSFDGKNSFKRPRYFDGQFLTAVDFQAEQEYHIGKRRLLNRALYGSGIVCGLEVAGHQEDNQVHISPGLALDGCGNEIYVDERVAVDLATLLPEGWSQCAGGDSSAGPNRTTKLWLCIQYREVVEDPVPVPGSSEDEGEERLDFSRYREGFRIDLRPEPPRGPKRSDCEESGHLVALGRIEIDEEGRLVDVHPDRESSGRRPRRDGRCTAPRRIRR